ncbi:MAG: response regulator [Pseudomonadota bacterium]
MEKGVGVDVTRHLSVSAELQTIAKVKNDVVMVVDDDLVTRKFLSEAFKSNGYTVVVVESGDEAIRRLQTGFVPSLMVLDVRMPGKDGISVCKWVRERLSSAVLPIIMATAVDDNECKHAAIDAGADDFFTKPFHIKEIITRANTHLALRAVLAESNSRRSSLEVLFETIPVGLVQFFDSPEPPFFNAIAREIFSLPNTEISATLLADHLGFLPKERCCGGKGPISEDRPYGNDRYRVDCRCIGFEGKHLGTLVVLRDITREWELDQLKTDFAQVVSHELRTPLTTIINAIDVIRDKEHSSPSIRDEMIELAYRNVGRINTMIRDILDLSKLESGQAKFTLAEHSLVQAVRHVADSMENEAKAKNLSVQLEISENLPNLFVDIIAIERVIANLLSNAIKYTKEGTKIQISVEQESFVEDQVAQARLAPRTKLLQSFAPFAIKVQFADQGPGIAFADRERVFEKFFRINKKEHAGIGGTGLGLSIARKIVRAYGGELWAESTPGQGATFSFRLPVFDEHTAPIVSVADRMQDAKRDRRTLGIVVLRLTDVETPTDPDQNTSFCDQMFDVARRSLYRSTDYAFFVPHLKELILLLEGCLPQALPQVGSRVAKNLRQHFLKIGHPIPPQIPYGHSYSPPDNSFEQAVSLLKKAQNAATKNEESPEIRRVMVVDDEPTFLAGIRQILRLHDFEPACFSNAEEALASLEEKTPDLVILDILMPDLDGYRLCMEIRSRPAFRDLPIFFISGVEREDPAARVFSAGGNEFLQKPIEMETLVRLLRLYLG